MSDLVSCKKRKLDGLDHEEDWTLPSFKSDNGFAVDKDLSKTVKPHQKEGVEFAWKRCFADVAAAAAAADSSQSQVSGFILAHFMGLGKSLTVLTLLHTVLAHDLVKHVLLIVPVNTLNNWENEVKTWIGSLNKPLKSHNLGKVHPSYRTGEVQNWKNEGGVLIVGLPLFQKMSVAILKTAQPDVLVIDEAHTVLKTSGTKTAKTLMSIQTKRKILLTGTPMQNNVTEFFHMVEFIRPGAFGVKSESEFEKVYQKPIEKGLPTDADKKHKLMSYEKQQEINQIVKPYIHRKGPEVLRNVLPKIHDHLLFLKPSPIQQKLLRAHERGRKGGKITRNFLSNYQVLAPLLNHPGCLRAMQGPQVEFFVEILSCEEFRLLRQTVSSKLVILAHILAMGHKHGRKTLVFSQCLKTLDIVEEFLGCDNWKNTVTTLKKDFSELTLGKLKKNQDYLRIDGSVQSASRGSLIEKFNGDPDSLKIFLISSLAGGIGINLCAASQVVLLDNHFNPTVVDQCIARAHRYGQKEEVSVYRLAIEQSLEAKVYKRAQNKSAVAMRVVDGIDSNSSFSSKELNELVKTEIVVECCSCNKNRLLPDSQEPPEDGAFWVCSDNQDVLHNSCSKEEEECFRKVGTPMNQEDTVLRHLRTVVGRNQKLVVQDVVAVETNQH